MKDLPHRERWPELKRLFEELDEFSAVDREPRLERLAAEDAELHAALVSLLISADRDSLLDRSPEELAGDVLQHLAADLQTFQRFEASEDPTPAASVRSLGRYRLTRKLGSGGMGEVWVAERDDEVMRQTVAIKILRPLVGGDATIRFHRERHILAALRHDGIAKILDAGIAQDAPPYLVLEYVDGLQIAEYCRRESLGIAARLALFLQVCDAVEHAHRQLIVHRDLKPTNILVNAEGQVKLLDFGIAKLLEASEVLEDNVQTRWGLLPMTPEYAAPEQVRGEPITTSTDVYGLGALLYELLSGRRPFETTGLTPAALEALICDTDPPRPSTVLPGPLGGEDRSWSRALQGDLDTMTLKALEKKPDDRYRSVADLAEDVRRYQRRLPLRARPASLSYRCRKFVARNRAAIAVSALVLCALAVGLFGTLWQSLEAERQAREAELQRARFESTGEFLFALLELVDPDLNPGQELSAVSLLDSGAAQVGQFAAGPEARVDLSRVLGVLYAKIGERERAEVLLRQAVVEAEEGLAPGDETIGQAKYSLGNYLGEMGELEESETTLREGLENLLTGDGKGRWLLATEYGLALTLYRQGRWQESLPILQESIRDHAPLLADDPRSLSHRSVVEALTLEARLLGDLGRWGDAEHSLSRAVDLARERLGNDHPALAKALEGQALAQSARDAFVVAEDSMKEALKVARGAHPEGAQLVARLLSRLAWMQRARGLEVEAEAHWVEALLLWEKLPAGTPDEQADRYRAEVGLALLRGDVRRAHSRQVAALDARRQAYGSNLHQRVAEEEEFLADLESAVLKLGSLSPRASLTSENRPDG